MEFSGEITRRRRGNAGGSNDSSHRHILSVDPSSKEGDFISFATSCRYFCGTTTRRRRRRREYIFLVHEEDESSRTHLPNYIRLYLERHVAHKRDPTAPGVLLMDCV